MLVVCKQFLFSVLVSQSLQSLNRTCWDMLRWSYPPGKKRARPRTVTAPKHRPWPRACSLPQFGQLSVWVHPGSTSEMEILSGKLNWVWCLPWCFFRKWSSIQHSLEGWASKPWKQQPLQGYLQGQKWRLNWMWNLWTNMGDSWRTSTGARWWISRGMLGTPFEAKSLGWDRLLA